VVGSYGPACTSECPRHSLDSAHRVVGILCQFRNARTGTLRVVYCAPNERYLLARRVPASSYVVAVSPRVGTRHEWL